MARRWVVLGAVLLLWGCSTQQPPVSEPATETKPPDHEVQCVPATCAEAARSCGQVEDGCGAMLECGTCAAGQTCSASGECVEKSTSSCVPTTCAAVGASCGALPDGCGGVLQCGTCEAGKSCSGGQCGANACTPKTCAQLSASCGAVSDGCGNVLQCGSCGAGTACQQNACVAVAAPGSTRWFMDTEEIGAIDSDAAGNFWTREARYIDGLVPRTVFVRRDPSGAAKATSSEFVMPSGFDVSPLGNLFFIFNDCWDAPTGDCMGLQKLSTNGATAWRKDIPRITSWAPAVDTHGNVSITVSVGEMPDVHWVLRKYAWDGAQLFEKPLTTPARVAADTADALLLWGKGWGENIIAGNPSTNASGDEGFVMKLSPAGDLIWFKRLRLGSGEMRELETTAAGTVVFHARAYATTFDWNGSHTVAQDTSYLFTLEANGTPRWAKPFKDYLAEDATLASVDAQGRAILIGNDYEAHLSKLVSVNLDGTKRWERHFQGAYVQAAEVSPDRSVLAAGIYSGTVDFGLGAKTAPHDRAGFLMRLNE